MTAHDSLSPTHHAEAVLESESVAQVLRQQDWSASPLGPRDQWPDQLKSTLSLMIHASVPMLLWWGKECFTFFNDASLSILGRTALEQLGRPASGVLGEHWAILSRPVSELFERAPQARDTREYPLPSWKDATRPESHHSVSLSPILDGDNVCRGVLGLCSDITSAVISKRRCETICSLSAHAKTSESAIQVCEAFIKMANQNVIDLPSVAVYLAERNGNSPTTRFNRVSWTGSPSKRGKQNESLYPSTIDLDGANAFETLRSLLQTQRTAFVQLEDLSPNGQTFLKDHHDNSKWVVFSLGWQGPMCCDGLLFVQIPQDLPQDDLLHNFLHMVAVQLTSGLTNSRVQQLEQQRKDSDAEVAAAVRDSEERYRAIVETQTEMVCRFRPEGVILFVNGAYARARGVRTEELVGVNFWSFIDEAQHESVRALLDQISPETPEVRIENHFETADGDRWTLWTNRGLAFDEDGRATEVQSTGIDITERKEIEQALRVSEQSFKALADTAPAMLWVSNSENNCTFLSQGWYDYTGQNPATGLARGWVNAIHPDDRERAAQMFLDAASRHEPFRIDYRLWSISSGYRWANDEGRPRFDEHGNYLGYIGAVFDVHTRKIAESNLRASEERFKIAADAVNGIIYEYDLRSGRVERSRGIYNVLGYQLYEAPASARWWWNQVHEHDRPQLQSAIDKAVASGGSLAVEYRVRHKDGHWVYVWDQALLIYDSTGTPSKVVGCTVDVTERKHFEESLNHARELAEAANRSRGEFLANMSHEIRTPMTSILGYADILSERLASHEDLQCVETIRRNGRFLLEIINDILDLSKIDAGGLELSHQPVRIESLVSEIVSLMQVRAKEKSLAIQIQFAGKLPAVIHTDPVRIRQVLINLVGNAIKFTLEGHVKIEVTYNQEMDQVQFDIVDTGIGIHPHDFERLFEPFVQADASNTRSAGGTGLGLTISRRLARALGGDVSVRSQLGVGSTFSFCLRCNTAEGTEIVEPILGSQPVPSPPVANVRLDGRILVVDDRRDIILFAKRFLEKCGGEVHTAGNGQEAIDSIAGLARDDRPVDLVLMDMQMPVMDGYSAVAHLRAIGFSQPIIALTANAMSKDRDRCLEAGCTDYATKPLDGPKLMEMIAYYLNAQQK